MLARHIPTALVLLRPVIAVVLVIDSLDGTVGPWFVILFVTAAVSDMLDGLIARKLKVTSTLGSKIDAQADAILYLSILFCIWNVHRGIIREFLVPIALVCSLQIASWVVSLIKYGRLSCHHAYTAKTWAIMLFVGITTMFAFNYAGITFWLVLILGVISTTEDIIMTLIIPKWSRDVKSIPAAIKLRKKMLKREIR